jgi:outer membrane protein W
MKTLLKLLFTTILAFAAVHTHAQEKKFDIGLRSGIFVPSHWMIQGINYVNYTDGSPVNMNIMGFGNGSVLNLYGKFFFNDHVGLTLDGGVVLFHSHSEELALAPIGLTDMYENKLTLIPVNLSMIYRIILTDSKLRPFFGAGTGVMIAELSQKHYPENAERVWLEGKSNPIDLHVFSGFDFPLYHDLIITIECKYNYAASDWTIKSVDHNSESKYKNLNIGGICLKFGLGFKF